LRVAGVVKVCREKADWNCAIQKLREKLPGDIYYHQEYFNLYTEGDGIAELFSYQSESDIFVFPYIVREIPNYVRWKDFETPYGYGGPLATTQNLAFLEQAWDSFDEYCQAQDIIAGFIRFHPFIQNQSYAERTNIEIVGERDIVITNLTKTKECIWSEYDSAVRNKIRKAMNQGLHLTKEQGSEALQIFKRLYYERMSELNAYDSYYFSENYFSNIEYLGEHQYRIYFAWQDSNIVGGALILLSEQFAHYHLSASPKKYQQLASNTYLRHTITIDLLDSNARILNYGGGRTASPDDALLKFKQSFSHDKVRFYYGKYLGNVSIYNEIRANWAAADPSLEQKWGSRFLCYRFRQ
jgi:hypothetical protein